ncbi:hypothetical protein C8258_21205 [Nocardia sp. MDA0666]|uniref:hypothetical protein n=1 Tax=Nocardia sp. MDA0666 TaxID=2135448 RepID=UPI000D11EDA2|nr:hypothetical protein [Nocardia sp. MDA0666]PSR65772.1 hypothetical protein C8258_21205 [Nocardia sp. MDA0666]
MNAVRVLLAAAGIASAGYGISLVLHMNTTDLMSIAVWSVGLLVLHDAVFAPLSAGVGVSVRHLIPGSVRGPVTIGVVATVVLAIVSVPVIGRAGAVANSTVLDRNYGAGLAVALAVVWAGVGVMMLWRIRRSRS